MLPIHTRAVLYTGDILALSTNSLGSLLQMPLGSGEQNMIRFAPSIYVLQYLDKSTQDNKELRNSALDHMKEGEFTCVLYSMSTCKIYRE